MNSRRNRPRRALRRTGAGLFIASAVLVGSGAAVWVAADVTTTTTTSTTTTTIAPEVAQTGWTVVASSARGVLVDRRTVSIDHIVFTVVRFRYRTTAFHWHAGTTDPPNQVGLPADSASHIDWGTENTTGIVGVFNGGFKADGKAGGILADGLKIEGLFAGDATVAIDTHGKIHIGVWGDGSIPLPAGTAVSYRQNLPLLVDHGVATTAAMGPVWGIWGAPLHAIPRQPRSGLGTDAEGNVYYLASMSGIMPSQLARAEVAVGIQTGMQLDMNPNWPILGAGPRVFTPAGGFPVVLPGSQHSPTVYLHSWTRDFFVAIAEPDAWTCSIDYPGWSTVTKVAVAQAVSLRGTQCPPPIETPTTSTSTPSTSSTTTKP